MSDATNNTKGETMETATLNRIGATLQSGHNTLIVVDMWCPMPGYLARTIEHRDETGTTFMRVTSLKPPQGDWFNAA